MLVRLKQVESEAIGYVMMRVGWTYRGRGVGRRAIIATESPKRKTRLNVTGCEGIITFVVR